MRAPPPPSVAFKSWVQNLKISGVRGGANPRWMPWVAGGALLAAGLAACSPQQQSRPAAVSGQGAAGAQGMQAQTASGGMQGHAGHTMSGGGTQGHSMAGMDHQSMMAHCAQMREQVRQGLNVATFRAETQHQQRDREKCKRKLELRAL